MKIFPIPTAVATLFLLLWTSLAFGDAYDSSCRISIDYKGKPFNIGTGVAFLEDEKDIWIITAGHVVILDETLNKVETTLAVEFFGDKTQSERIPAKVLWYVYKKGTETDLAVIKAHKKDFGKWPLPPIIQIAPKDTVIKRKTLVASVGCPNGSKPSSFFTTIKSVDVDGFMLNTNAEPGQSGSGVFTKDGIVGIVILRDGTCVSLSKIYKEIESKVEPRKHIRSVR